MAGHETHTIAQRKEFLAYRTDQLLVVAAREVGTTNRLLKQNIANQRQVCWRMIEANMSWRVSRTMNDRKGFVCHSDGVAIV